MKTNSSTDRPGRETDQEAWAFDILSRHLTESGHSIVNVRRPDQLNRSTRDVDFLIEFDGHDVAVEVTRLDQERHWWVLLDRLQRAILAELGELATHVSWTRPGAKTPPHGFLRGDRSRQR